MPWRSVYLEKFQFALPHGERPDWLNHAAPAQRVSIRAPAWGATTQNNVQDANPGFQFALPHGERRHSRAVCVSLSGFQFALPHGERLPSCNDRYSLHRKRTIR